MNFTTKRIGFHYPCIIRKIRRGEYQVNFGKLPTEIFYCNIRYADNPRFYADINRTRGCSKKWHIYFRKQSGQAVDYEGKFSTLLDAAYFARNHMMEWEGWCDE